MPAPEVTPEEQARLQDFVFLDMLGEELKAAILAARARLGDETILVRIDRGLCSIERGGVEVAKCIGPDDAPAALEALA